MAGKVGSDPQNAEWAVPMSDPTMKKSSVTTIRVLPPPTVKSVPEAQPPPSCMPMPKRNAPTSTGTPTGCTRAVQPRPERLARASSGKNAAQVTASISICARRPAPRPSAMKMRHAEVKPNAA